MKDPWPLWGSRSASAATHPVSDDLDRHRQVSVTLGVSDDIFILGL